MEHLYSKYHGCGHADMSKWYAYIISRISYVILSIGTSYQVSIETVMHHMWAITQDLHIWQSLKMNLLPKLDLKCLK